MDRRQFLRVAATAGGVAATFPAASAASATAHAGDAAATAAARTGTSKIPYYGRHQAGIDTTPANCLVLAAFDLATSSRDNVRLLLRSWTEAASRMAVGKPSGAASGSAADPPTDSGETLGLGAERLTVTFGFGPGFFDKLGLQARRPAGLQPLPPMTGDALDPAYCDGDIVIQACAENHVVASHAVRQLSRMAPPLTTPRWVQTGFGPAARAPQVKHTPRNLFGMKDGTGNPAVGTARFGRTVWVQPGDQPEWMVGGSYLAVRRITMHLEEWDGSGLDDQEGVIGRHKVSGAPLSGGDEFTPPDYNARSNGKLVIPPDAHIRAARPVAGAAGMLRRGYGYDEGLNGQGQAAAGVVFLAYVRDLTTQFVPVLTRVTNADAMTKEYTTHVGSAVFAVPPGCQSGGYVGQTLLG